MDTELFNHQLYVTDWSNVYRCVRPDDKWSAFLDQFIRQLDTVAPVRRVPVRPTASPPVSAHTQELLRRRRAALAAGTRHEYRELNRQCRAACRADCRAFYEQQISRGGRHSLWRALRPVIGRKQATVETPTVTPDALNDYYVTIGPATAAAVPPPARPVPVRLSRVSTSSFEV